MENKASIICSACKAENDPGEIRCRRCGLSFDSTSMDDHQRTIACPRCAYENQEGSFFCYKCGKYFVNPDELNGKSSSSEHTGGNPSDRHMAKIVMPDGSEIKLGTTPIFIERSDFDGTLPSDIVMSISRQHLLITFENGIYFVQDYGRDGRGSTNHTLLNGIDIYKKGKQPLKDGDIIEVANQPELLLIFKQD